MADKPTGPIRIALIAHDAKKAEMCDWVAAHEAKLARCKLVATGTTGLHLSQRCPSLTIERLLSGPLGGDQQIGARIVEGKIDALIFFIDPLSAHPHDVDVKALVRVAVLSNILFALNRTTADALLSLMPEGDR